MQTASNKQLLLAAIFGATAVALGAFGAHSLKPLLDSYQLAIYEKGVQYQFYHTLALLATGILVQLRPAQSRRLNLAGWLFAAGIVCFSGSLYLLACHDLLAMPVGWAGPVTPLGGLAFIAGWILLLLSVQKTQG